MARSGPFLVSADASGRIVERPHLSLLGRRGAELVDLAWDDLMPLPGESELFLLPGRKGLGRAGDGSVAEAPGVAVAAFAAPGHTLSCHPAYRREASAPLLPLFAYGAVGYGRGRFWVAARKVDEDRRQVFSGIRAGLVESRARMLLLRKPENRLLAHIVNNCVLRYGCPAAKNFSLGRFEAPLPTSRSCNARCLGCISAQGGDSPLKVTPQCRLDFTPSPQEICEVMLMHAERETGRPIVSFGQGCEGEPLMNPGLLEESIRLFRLAPSGSEATVNCNTNASRPEAVALLARAGLTSIRVSLNSARPEVYRAYYRPVDYDFGSVTASIEAAKTLGVHVALNLLYFPGLTDTEEELAALTGLVRGLRIDMIQWRNLNMDPDWLWETMAPFASRPMGLSAFMERLGKACPWLRHGYFNPWLGARCAPVRGGMTPA